ncbi:MAG TPA: hypothetical protein VII47_12300 [Actinomycetota bacterium]
MTQAFYRRPKIGAGDIKPAAAAASAEPAPKFYSAMAPQTPSSDKPSSYPGWLIQAKKDSPSSYPTMHATFIGGSPCAGSYHSIN